MRQIFLEFLRGRSEVQARVLTYDFRSRNQAFRIVRRKYRESGRELPFLDWLIENWDVIFAIIKDIIGLFSVSDIVALAIDGVIDEDEAEELLSCEE